MPEDRVVATAYLGLVPGDARPQLPTDTRWHPIDELPEMAFDHAAVVEAARAVLKDWAMEDTRDLIITALESINGVAYWCRRGESRMVPLEVARIAFDAGVIKGKPPEGAGKKLDPLGEVPPALSNPAFKPFGE